MIGVLVAFQSRIPGIKYHSSFRSHDQYFRNLVFFVQGECFCANISKVGNLFSSNIEYNCKQLTWLLRTVYSSSPGIKNSGARKLLGLFYSTLRAISSGMRELRAISSLIQPRWYLYYLSYVVLLQ